MTIAAGFPHADGVLLVSDPQQEGGTTKYYGPKVGFAEIPFGKIACAFAGHAVFATTAIQSCVAKLQNTPPKDTISDLAGVVEREYRRLVFQHPDYGKDYDLQYWLLISLWSRERKETSLWVTQEHALQSCFGFQAIGSGLDLANVIVRPFTGYQMTEENALILAAYMMAMVKANVSGCGGESQFVSMRNDGSVPVVISMNLDEIEVVAAAYDKAAHTLLFAIADDDQANFEQAIAQFSAQARMVRQHWKTIKTANPAILEHLQSNTADPSPPPPSP